MNVEEISNPQLPYSNYRYLVNQYGELFDLEKNAKLELIEKDNNLYVELDWVDGKKLYNAAMVVIVAFRPNMGLPSYHYKDIIPLYRDNNNKNLNPNNLTYMLPITGIEINSRKYREFYYIPEHTQYAINKSGIVYNIKRDKILDPIKSYKNSETKAFVLMYTDSGSGKSRLTINKILGMVFLDHGANYNELKVNHINGDINDFKISNLEWVTVKENINRMFDKGTTSVNTFIESKNYITNNIKRYRSITDICKYAKLDKSYFKECLDRGFIKLYDDPIEWYYIKTDKEDWKDLTKDEIESITVRRSNEGTDMMALNIFTNQLFIFPSISKMVRSLNVDISGAIQHVERDSLTPYHGYILRYLTDNRPLPKFTDDQLYIIKDHIENNKRSHIAKGYSVIDLTNNEKKIFTNKDELRSFLLSNLKILKKTYTDKIGSYVYNNKYKVTEIDPKGTFD